MSAIQISSDWQLFVDGLVLNDVLPSLQNLRQKLHQPVKYQENPIMLPEKPWEGPELSPYKEKESSSNKEVSDDRLKGVSHKIISESYSHQSFFFGGVMFDEEENIFKIWYSGSAGGEEYNRCMCYATSSDGIHWDRPNLGLVDYNGSKNNNIFFKSLDEEGRKKGLVIAQIHGVIKDKYESDPNKRYKSESFQAGLGDWRHGNRYPSPKIGVYLCWSPDGIHWTTAKEPIFERENPERTPEFGLSDVTLLACNRKKKKYVLFLKGHIFQAWGRGDQGPHKRVQQISESDDFEHWTKPVVALKPDDCDPPDLNIYGMAGFDYEDAYLGIVNVLHSDDKDRTIDMQLVSSRDGRNWWRAGNREVFIPVGEPGTWDAGMVGYIANPPIEVDEELWFYYWGTPWTHLPIKPGDPPMQGSALGLAKLKRGRFVSMDADEEEGWLITKPLKFNGNTLHVNADTSKGYLLVEILEVLERDLLVSGESQWDLAVGAPFQGYSRYECNRMTADSLDHVITWKGKPDISRFSGKRVVLRFIMKNCSLYGFRVGSPEGVKRKS